MKLVNIPFSEVDISWVLSESARFRSMVSQILMGQNALVQSAEAQLSNLREYIRTNFDRQSRISAIKYVRQWAVDNARCDLKGLREAKELVDNVIPYGS